MVSKAFASVEWTTIMRWPALFLILLGLIGTAAAQNKAATVEFLPIPETMPALLFTPEPLAGSMLEPLQEAEIGAVRETPAGAGVAAVASPSAGEAPPAGGTQAVLEAAPAAPAGESTGFPAEETPHAAVEPEADTAAPEPAEHAPSAAKPQTTIHVIVENVQSASGTINVAVCDTALSREGCPYDTAVPASQGFVEAVFEGIPPGTYAVVGYHDENGNDEFDKFLGMPREPYALSSKAAEELVPTFADAALPINQGDNVIIIRLKKFGGG